MTYLLTIEGGPSRTIDDVAHRHFLRQSMRRGDELTRVRRGYVVTLPGGRLVALIAVGA
ncbi:hypothetical protein [Streptomyces sp. NPDC004528]|uniref:hypothetical protein n=1 Tax=Streptomyces sp. NPDC004528 TaxID=3154550 RepID=UPI0033BC99B2